tara:strand:+ start:2420 stop:2644 length:225 start_codon:yes stop_codon:yes gene_type:complete
MNEEDNFEFKEKQIELQALDQASDLGLCIDFSELLEKNGVDYVLARMLPSAKRELRSLIIHDYFKRSIDAHSGL